MKQKRRINPILEVGDRVILLKTMEEESNGPAPGTTGTVYSIFNFDENTTNYGVNWDDGTKLNLLSDVDTYMLENEFPKKQISEEAHWADDVTEINENFKFGLLRKFLNRLRDSGITNMFGAAPYLYMGKERIEAAHKYDSIAESNSEEYQEMLDLADKTKDEMIRGVIKIIEKQKKEVTVDEVNRIIGRWANKILTAHFKLH
jgi:hypothetical protein